MVLFIEQERGVILFYGAILIFGSLLIAGSKSSPQVEDILFVLDLQTFLSKIEVNSATAGQFETLSLIERWQVGSASCGGILF